MKVLWLPGYHGEPVTVTNDSVSPEYRLTPAIVSHQKGIQLCILFIQ